MDELTLVRALCPTQDLVDLGELAGIRATMLAPSKTGLAPSKNRRSLRRVVVGATLAAAAVSMGLIVAPIGPDGRPAGVGIAPADAITVLRQAAVVADAGPDVVPRPDQFYFVRADGTESWLSMDGTHDGEARTAAGVVYDYPGCRGGVALVAGDYTGRRAQPCHPDPAYLADAPTTPTGMKAFLQSQFGDAGLNGIGKGVYELLEYHYLRSSARAAVFEALTSFPGLQIVTDHRFGRNVVGVSWTVTGPDNEPAGGQEGATLLFSTTTHAYLGMETTGLRGEAGSSQAPTEVGIVDRVGEQP